jgi:uncharacterized membrane protein
MPDDEASSPSRTSPGGQRREVQGNVLARNIATMVALRQQAEGRRGAQERLADRITAFTGSMVFVYLHLAVIGGWVAINLGWLAIPPFDPYPFGLLTMIGSLEAIFLSTFVLISQNRMMAAADRRAELDLQIGLLAEHEITRIVILLDAVARHLGVPVAGDAALDEAKQDIDPTAVVEAIENHQPAP